MESEASIICLSLREKVGGNCQGNGEKSFFHRDKESNDLEARFARLSIRHKGKET